MTDRYDAFTDHRCRWVYVSDNALGGTAEMPADEADRLARKLIQAADIVLNRAPQPMGDPERVRLAGQMRNVLAHVARPSDPASNYATLHRAMGAFAQLVMGETLDHIDAIAAIELDPAGVAEITRQYAEARCDVPRFLREQNRAAL